MNKYPIFTFVLTVAAVSAYVLAADPGLTRKRDPLNPAKDIEIASDVEPVALPIDRETRSPLEILQDSREKLKNYTSIRANLVEKVSIPDRTMTASHSFTARGSYLQGKNLQEELQLRLEFSLQVGANKGSLLEVCDGQLLWTRHDIAGETQITRRDVRQILEAAKKNGKVAPNMLIAELGLGGLPGLLAAFENSMVFDSVATSKIDERPVVMIEGVWNREYRQLFGAENEKGETRELPPFVPDIVRIYFDRETEFPRRIIYLKTLEEKALRPMLALDFTKVALNQPVNEDDFLFIPPDRPSPVDITNLYLERLLAPPETEGQPGAAPPNGTPPPTTPQPKAP